MTGEGEVSPDLPDDIFAAARRGCLDTCRRLATRSNVHIADSSGNTVLHIVCLGAQWGEGAHRDVILHLRSLGAAEDHRNHEGWTAKELARETPALAAAFEEEIVPVEEEWSESAYEYLNRVVFPVLSPALVEVAASRPEDPLAMLMQLVKERKELPATSYNTFSTVSAYGGGGGSVDVATPQSRSTASHCVNTASLIKRDGLFPSTSTANATPSPLPSLSALRSYNNAD